MTQQEFTERTGLTPTSEEYKQIESMYLETGNMDKDEFCKDFKKHSQSTILATFYKQAGHLKEKCDAFRKDRNEMVDFLLERAQTFGDVQLLEKAIQMTSHPVVIRKKLLFHYPYGIWIKNISKKILDKKSNNKNFCFVKDSNSINLGRPRTTFNK
ncbi:MAG: hypothetical protein LUH63_11785 [Parabacteroides sp.]|nr:hypothetical protein [Parabacteroides sp.]